MDIRGAGKYISNITKYGYNRETHPTTSDRGPWNPLYSAAGALPEVGSVLKDYANLSVLSNISNNMTSAAIPGSEPNLSAWRILAALSLTFLPFILIYLWDLWEQWKIDEEEDMKTLCDVGDATEGMTRDGEITERWNIDYI